MTRYIRRAFTLVELLAVILMITILVALLMPALGSARDMVMQTQCANNLNRLWQAICVCRSERAADAKPDFVVSQWTGTLLAYLENQSGIYICPAAEAVLQGGQGAGSSSSSNYGSGFSGSGNTGAGQNLLPQLAEVKTIAGPVGCPYVSPMDAGPWVIKFSDEQYQDARSKGLLNNDDSADFIRGKYDCTYKPGANPHIYWLCFEDHGQDDDFKDVMIKVTEESDGSVHLWIRCGYSGHTNILISKTDGRKLLDLPINTEGMQWTFRETNDGGVTVTPWDGTLGGGGGESGDGWVGSAPSVSSSKRIASMPHPPRRESRH